MYCYKLRNIFQRNDEDKLDVTNKGIFASLSYEKLR